MKMYAKKIVGRMDDQGKAALAAEILNLFGDDNEAEDLLHFLNLLSQERREELFQAVRDFGEE